MLAPSFPREDGIEQVLVVDRNRFEAPGRPLAINEHGGVSTLCSVRSELQNSELALSTGHMEACLMQLLDETIEDPAVERFRCFHGFSPIAW